MWKKTWVLVIRFTVGQDVVLLTRGAGWRRDAEAAVWAGPPPNIGEAPRSSHTPESSSGGRHPEGGGGSEREVEKGEEEKQRARQPLLYNM